MLSELIYLFAASFTIVIIFELIEDKNYLSILEKGKKILVEEIEQQKNDHTL